MNKDPNPRMRYFYRLDNAGVVAAYSEKTFTEDGSTKIAYSAAFCSPHDNFDKRVARDICKQNKVTGEFVIPRKVINKVNSDSYTGQWTLINQFIITDLLTKDIPKHAIDTLLENI